MRLQMGDLVVDIGCQPVERADLIGNHRFQIVGAHLDATPAKSPKVVEPRMGADADACFLGALHEPAHGHRIAGVKPARDARRTNDLQDGVVIADALRAETLAHVGVQIDGGCHNATLWIFAEGSIRSGPVTLPAERAASSGKTLWQRFWEHNTI